MRLTTTLIILPFIIPASPTSAAEQSLGTTFSQVKIGFLGPAREISHSSSASRDTFLPHMQISPRSIVSGGVDAGFFSLRSMGHTWRLGFQDMMELESNVKTKGFSGIPAGDIHFWRGVYGYSLAWSMEHWSNRLLGPNSALDVTLSWRHESEHYTGDNSGGEGIDYRDRPHIGDFLMIDFALRLRLGNFDLLARLQHKFFLPNMSAYNHGPGIDLHARLRYWNFLHPFVSVFAEYLSGDRFESLGHVPDAYLLRGLFGVMVPSTFGDLHLYVSADVGHRKGLAVYTEEATLGGGVRFAFF